MTDRKKIFAGNWKMNFGPSEALKYFSELRLLLQTQPSKNEFRVLFPAAYTLQEAVLKTAAECKISLGAQNVHWETKGAFTGELSGQALKELGVDWVLIAHSERRQFFGETDETAARRLKAAIQIGLNVIFCVGERLEERESGRMNEVLNRQVSAFNGVLKSASLTAQQTISVAYEPVWAIGTGKTATPQQAQEAHAFIRGLLQSELGNAGAATSLLYGGSVTSQNAKELLSQTDVDGVLVGGASLKPAEFSSILQA